MLAVLTRPSSYARAGNGPFLVEAHTYRIEAHTNADDATRYRDVAEVRAVAGRDPIARLETYLRARGAARRRTSAALAAEAEAVAADAACADERRPAPSTRWSLFEHVYAEPTPQLREQRRRSEAELAAEPEED